MITTESKISSYSGQCPFLMTRRSIPVRFEKQTSAEETKAIPVENQCDYLEDCPYTHSCPVYKTCEREIRPWAELN